MVPNLQPLYDSLPNEILGQSLLATHVKVNSLSYDIHIEEGEIKSARFLPPTKAADL